MSDEYRLTRRTAFDEGITVEINLSEVEQYGLCDACSFLYTCDNTGF